MCGWVYSFNVGAEAEASGRAPSKNFITLRRDLAALPHVLCTREDIVLAPPQRPEFLQRLRDAGFDLPGFHEQVPAGVVFAGTRPFATPGDHMRRSHVCKFREDVAACRSLEQIRAAIARFGPRVVLKAEFSSSGLGQIVCDEWSDSVERWAAKRLRQDGVLTVEPWLDILFEVSVEWLQGLFNGISQVDVVHSRWQGQFLGDPRERMPPEVFDFIYANENLERTVCALNVPGQCASENCGLDVAIVRGAHGLEFRVLELNARTTMSHFALAAKRRVPSARHFSVVRASTLIESPHLLPLTDPQTALVWCAVLDCSPSG
jgi:hypothetical protein